MSRSARPRSGGVDRLVRLAHDHLGMEFVYVAEFVDGRQVYRAVAGGATGFGAELGTGPELDGTYCQRMVDGVLPNVIPDTAQQPLVQDLGITMSGPIGAYVGVPIYLPDGELYGSFCALSHAAQDDLNVRDGKFMTMLSELLSHDLAAERQLATQQELVEQVLATGSVQMALQPVVDLLSGRCISMEALARFPQGLGRTDQVFTMADAVGLRIPVEQLAVQKALEKLPLLAPEQCLAVNLSPDAAFRAMGLVPPEQPMHQLILEITEHAAVEDYARIRDELQPLRERGMRLAIDDAGAGFASLRHIVELRPDIIKIDRALIAGIQDDASRRSAVTTFVLLALDIGATVVAEGVETRDELVAVATLGVDCAQGYLLARPSLDTDDVTRWASGAPLLDGVFARQ